MATLKIGIEGMSCNHCVMAVKKSVGALVGVSSIEVDLPGKSATVEYDPAKTEPGKIKSAVTAAGYKPV